MAGGEEKRDQAVDVLNDLKLCTAPQEKAAKVKELTELTVHVARQLLPEFVPEVIGLLQTESNAQVRKEVAGFLESLGSLPTETIAIVDEAPYMNDAFGALATLTRDKSEKVGKRAMMAAISLFSAVFKGCLREQEIAQLLACWPSLCDTRASAVATVQSETAKGGFKVYACKFLECQVLFLNEEALKTLCRSDPMVYAKFNSGARESSDAIFDIATLLAEGRASSVPAPLAIVVLTSLGSFAKARPELFAKGSCDILGRVAAALGKAKDQGDTKITALIQSLKQVLLTLVKSEAVCGQGVHEECLNALASIGFEEARNQARRSRSGSKRAHPGGGYAWEERGKPAKQTRPADALDPATLLSQFTALVHQIGSLLESNDLSDFEGPVLSPEATADAVISNFGLDPSDFFHAEQEAASALDEGSYAFQRSPDEALMDASIAAIQEVGAMTKEDVKLMSLESLKRVFAANMEALGGGTTAGDGEEMTIQDRVLAKIVTMVLGNFWEGDRDYCQSILDSLVDHILEKMQSERGHATSMGLFYATFALGESFRGVYNALLLRIVKGMRQTLPPHDTALCKLVLEVPILPQNEIVVFLRDMIIMSSDKEGDDEAVEWATLGLNTLRDLVFERPSLRRACLNLSLTCAMHKNEGLRTKAISLVADTLYPVAYLQGDIESFALKALRQLTTRGDKASPDEVGRHMELFFALCAKKHDLLHELLSMFARASKVQRQVMNKKVTALAKEIPSSSPSLLIAVESPPRGSEILLLLMLHSMAEKGALPKQLVRAVHALYRKNGDPRFLVPIFADMPKADAIDFMPKFVELPEAARRTAIANAFSADPGGRGPESLSASDLFVRIHLIDETKHGIPLKKLIDCTNLCFQMKDIFTPKVLSISIQQLVQYTPLPMLFMRTVIQTSKVAPQLKGFIVNLLARLIGKKIWEDVRQWQGFLMCASILSAFPVLLQLPAPHLQAALKRMPDLKPKLCNFVQGEAGYAQKLPRTTLQVLGLS